MSTSPIILILGAGPNIGQHVARAFAAKSYKVALASRKIKEEDSTTDQVNISSDLSDPESVIGVFAKVKTLLGLPSVVVYNGKNISHYSQKHTAIIPADIYPQSWRSNAKRSEEPTFPLFGRLHPRLQHQYHQRLRRSTASGFSLRPTPRLGCENIHIYGEYPEYYNHGTAYGSWCRQVGHGAHCPSGCCGLHRSRIQV